MAHPSCVSLSSFTTFKFNLDIFPMTPTGLSHDDNTTIDASKPPPPPHQPQKLPSPILLNDVFIRPMTPAPPPLVHINGSPGVGKQAIAESLALLLGLDKSLLVHSNSSNHQSEPARYRHHHHHHHYQGQRQRQGHHPLKNKPSEMFRQSQRGGREGDMDMNMELQLQLQAILSHPHNAHRIAILPRYASNIPSGRAIVQSYRVAAERVGRVFVSVALACKDEEEWAVRRGSLQRRCSFKKGSYDDNDEEEKDDDGNNEGGQYSEEKNENRDVSGGGGGTCNKGREDGLALVEDIAAVMIDVSRVRPLEAAMRIAEVVWDVVEERDAELCASAATTPSGGEEEWRWK